MSKSYENFKNLPKKVLWNVKNGRILPLESGCFLFDWRMIANETNCCLNRVYEETFSQFFTTFETKRAKQNFNEENWWKKNETRLTTSKRRRKQQFGHLTTKSLYFSLSLIWQHISSSVSSYFWLDVFLQVVL